MESNSEKKSILVLSGPTGSGESAITNEIIVRYPKSISRLITSTTRPLRDGEIDGVDYHFFSRHDFLEKKEAGLMLEVTYIEGRDVYYGTYKPQLEKQLKDFDILIANTDIVGTLFYRTHYNAVSIFVMPPSIEMVVERLKKRNPSISQEELEARRAHAQHEIEFERPEYDYEVINREGKLEEAVEEVIKIMKQEGYIISDTI